MKSTGLNYIFAFVILLLVIILVSGNSALILPDNDTEESSWNESFFNESVIVFSENDSNETQILNESEEIVGEEIILENGTLEVTFNETLEENSSEIVVSDLNESEDLELNKTLEIIDYELNETISETSLENETRVYASSTPGNINTCQTIDTAGVYNITSSPASVTSHCFIITADNVYIRGNGKTIDGNDGANFCGFNITNRKNVTIDGIRITDFYYGIYIYNSTNVTLIGNVVSSGTYGLNMVRSPKNNFTFNNFTSNTYNFYVYINSGSDFDNFIPPNNLVDGKKIYYNYSISNYEYNSVTAPDAGVVYCTYSNNITVRDLNLSAKNYQGLQAFNTKRLNVINVTAERNYYGVSNIYGEHGNFLNNTFRLNTYGIHVASSGNKNNTFSGNEVNFNTYGIYLANSLDSRLDSNQVFNNTQYGIKVELGGNISLTNNYVINSTLSAGAGIWLYNTNDTFLDSNTYNSSYYDLKIELSRNTSVNNDSFYDGRQYALYNLNSNNTQITNSYFQNASQNIYVTGYADFFSVFNSSFFNSRGTTISPSGNIREGVIDNNYFYNCQMPISISGSYQGMVVSNNRIENILGTGISINSPNTSVFNNLISGCSPTSFPVGISVSMGSVSNSIIFNNTITNLSSSNSVFGIQTNNYWSTIDIKQNTIFNLYSSSNYARGIYFMYGGDNQTISDNVIMNVTGGSLSFPASGIYFANPNGPPGQNNNTYINNTIIGSEYGIYLSVPAYSSYTYSNRNITFINTQIINSSRDGLFLGSANFDFTFINTTILGTNPKYYDLVTSYLSPADAYSNIYFKENYVIGNYSFAMSRHLFSFSNEYGEVSFFDSPSSLGTNLTNDLQIKNSSFFNGAFNLPANVTLYGVPVFDNPKLLKNDEPCNDGECVNYTDLISGDVRFYVSGWGNYSIEDYDVILPYILLNLPVLEFNSSNQSVNFNFTAFDDRPIEMNCTVYVDGVAYVSNSSVSNNTLTNLVAHNISGGYHQWNVSCKDKRNTNWSETRTFYVDIFAPVVLSHFFTPNSSDGIDPGANVSFSANISEDRMGVSSVILEYHNGTSWNNQTMDLISGNFYQGNITLTDSEQIYTYRIFSNDSFDNRNATINQTFNSFWDCSWNLDPVDAGAFADWNRNTEIYNLILNNTGDVQYANNNCSLSFHLVHNLGSGRVYFNNSFTNAWAEYFDLINVPAKTEISLPINVSFFSEILEENLRIGVNEVSSLTNTSRLNSSAVVVSATGGPYLYQTLQTPSTLIYYLSRNNFSVSGYVRDVTADGSAENSAYNVSLSWNFPQSWVSGGNLSLFFVNITDKQFYVNGLNISLNENNLPSLEPKTYSFYLNSSGVNSSGDLIVNAENQSVLTNQVNITFLCDSGQDGIYVTACGTLDGDYSTPSTGGGSGSSRGSEQSYFSRYIQSEDFEIVRGKDQSFEIIFENPYTDAQLLNVTVNLTGLLSQYISISPNHFSVLNPGENVTFIANITAPAYFNEGDYDLKLKIEAKYKKNSSSFFFSATKDFTLNVFEISRGDAIYYLNEINYSIIIMNNSGLKIFNIEDYYSKMLENYGSEDFAILKENYLSAKQIFEDAKTAQSELNELRALLKQANLDGIETPSTGKLVALAESAFLRGSYDLAVSRIKEAKLSYALEVKGEFNFLRYVKNNPIQFAVVLVILLFVSLVGSLILRYRFLKIGLNKLDKEEVLLIGLMRVVQKDCFDLGKMSMEEYQNTMIQYEARLSKVIQGKIELESKLSNLLKLNGNETNSLEKEALRLTELIKKTQRRYFEFGKLETRIYENMVKSYISRLSEVEEKIATINARNEIRKIKFKHWWKFRK